MALATGQITIIDYNDALTLTGFIQANKSKTQMFNQDNGTYIPDWATGNMILTPSLFQLGTATDIISTAAVTSILWYDVTAGTEVAITNNSSYAIGASKPNALTIKTNVLAGLPGKDYMVKITFKDPSTGLDLIYKTDISLSRVINGSGIADGTVTAIEGNIFKNGTVTSLRLLSELWRGSTIDTSLVTYQWFIMDASAGTDTGGGIGWRKLTEVASVNTGVTSNTLTVFPNAFLNIGVFKCTIKDTDSSSSTYNTVFVDTITLIDQSDPIQVSIVSSGGDVFKNSVGSTVLTAKLYQAAAEIDVAGTKYGYSWKKYNSAGTLDGTFGTKTGKNLSVGDSDVDVKATFVVEVS